MLVYKVFSKKKKYARNSFVVYIEQYDKDILDIIYVAFLANIKGIRIENKEDA